MATETIYISDSQRETWEEIQSAAKADNRGIGYMLIEAWKKAKKVKEA